jgi:cytochrome c oxidase subunit 4
LTNDVHVSSAKTYTKVLATLVGLTVITVLAAGVDFGSGNAVIALLIASIKASLVALFFMHLISERQMIYVVLAFTAFFLIGLMFLTIGSFGDFPPLTTTH